MVSRIHRKDSKNYHSADQKGRETRWESPSSQRPIHRSISTIRVEDKRELVFRVPHREHCPRTPRSLLGYTNRVSRMCGTGDGAPMGTNRTNAQGPACVAYTITDSSFNKGGDFTHHVRALIIKSKSQRWGNVGVPPNQFRSDWKMRGAGLQHAQ